MGGAKNLSYGWGLLQLMGGGMGAIDYEYSFEGFRDSRVQNHTPTQAPTVSLRGPAQDLQNEREARVFCI